MTLQSVNLFIVYTQSACKSTCNLQSSKMSFLSAEVRLELEETNQRRQLESEEVGNMSRTGIGALINEAISEEVNINMALEAVKSLEEASLAGPSISKGRSTSKGPSTSRGVKRPASAAAGGNNEADSEDDFIEPSQNIPATRPAAALRIRGKNLSLVRKVARAPSPTDSIFSSSSSSSAPKSLNEGWMAILEEELQRREEFNRRFEGQRQDNKKKIKATDDLLSRIKGEKKSLRAHKEAIREQLRLLDAQELFLDKRERSATEKKREYEAIDAKFNKINKL
ncbi:hypothetical protein NQ315_014291 [Exocentrus adspersus]|uniref:Uncharacterized protein n=1 Tax=Exocentrus adspersus TaxID=1586481 RepID=A0AAV8VIZ4_9CUCU|nr:hypothetical protein NQ315_014291 [Exocentrus adspersus]